MRKTVLTSLAVAVCVLIAGSTLAMSAGAPPTLTVHMTGGQEVPKGSPTGSGTFRFELLPSVGPNVGRVCFSLTWSKIDTPIASHIHKGGKGVSGPIVIVLFKAPPVGPSGCRNAPKSLIKAIQQKPSAYYVNVHTNKYPTGAIRAQL
jgi:CHRD domain